MLGVSIYIYTHIHIYIYIYVYVYMTIYICIHTQIDRYTHNAPTLALCQLRSLRGSSWGLDGHHGAAGTPRHRDALGHIGFL